jgi:hypothetical protein
MNTSTFFEHRKWFFKLRTTFLKIMNIFSQRGYFKNTKKSIKKKEERKRGGAFMKSKERKIKHIMK